VFFVWGSILAEEFLTSPKTYEQEAQKHTEGTAAQSMDDMEKVKSSTIKQSNAFQYIGNILQGNGISLMDTIFGRQAIFICCVRMELTNGCPGL